MAVYKFSDWEMEDDPFLLIGIHSTVEPYRIAFLINKFLKISFKRELRDQDVNMEDYIAQYPVFHFQDKENNVSLYLAANHCKAQHIGISSSGGSLFENNEPTEIKTTLIKEYRRVDYLIKIEKDVEHYPLEKMLTELIKIPQVISVYEIDSLSIKNKDYLIFE
jgi:hypothetical protein